MLKGLISELFSGLIVLFYVNGLLVCDSPMRKDGLLVWDRGSTSLVGALVCVSPKLKQGGTFHVHQLKVH